MKRYLLFISLFIYKLVAVGQFNKGGYQFPETFNEGYNFNAKAAFDKLNVKPLSGFTKGQSDAFRVSTIYNTQYMFDNDEIYTDWYESENYIYKIFDTIISAQYRETHPFKIFLTRDPSVNAFALDNGFLFINVGIFKVLRDEASLASVIAHEIGHAVGSHGYKRQVQKYQALASNTSITVYDNLIALYAQTRKDELCADTFSLTRVAKAGYNISTVSKEFEAFEMENIAYKNSHQYRARMKAFTYDENIRPQDAFLFKEYEKKIATHPSNKERIMVANKMIAKLPKNSKRFIIDSTYFFQLKKLANEECKRIFFENGDYNKCLQASFIDYLYNDKNLKNLYYIIECIRRKLYVEPELAKKGFLAEDYSDPDLYDNNYSILYKPIYLFADSVQAEELKEHPLFSIADKPFNNYKDALFFFCEQAKKYNFNEINFTLGLYYYSIKDEQNYLIHLKRYVENGSGLNIPFANYLLANGQPGVQAKKTFLLFNNTSNYSYGDNDYYQILNKKKYNEEIIKTLVPDNTNTTCVIVNELLGSKPRYLYQMQKLQNIIHTLYLDSDIELFKKKRLNSRETMEERSLSKKYNKNFLMLAPEWYSWFLENDYKTICFVDMLYEYKGVLDENEYYNNYTAYYFDLNGLRPYFKDAVRNGFTRKQTTSEMLKDIENFLYGYE